MKRGIAGPVLITAIGLILALAVKEAIDGVDLEMVGWILAGAGVVWGIVNIATGTSGGHPELRTTTTTAQQGGQNAQQPAQQQGQPGMSTTEQVTEFDR